MPIENIVKGELITVIGVTEDYNLYMALSDSNYSSIIVVYNSNGDVIDINCCVLDDMGNVKEV